MSNPPTFIEPMAPLLVKALPDGDAWLFELKLDGYRALLIKDRERVEIRSRKDKSLTKMYPAIASAVLHVKAQRAVIDGEICALDDQGRPSFQALQHRGSHATHPIVFYAFDLLHLDGKTLTGQPLTRRRANLSKIIGTSGLLLSQPLPGNARAIVDAVRRLGLEGVIAKRKDSPYEPGERSGAWQKLKLDLSQEFVIGGYRPGLNAIDALLVGYYEARKLRFAGKVKAGFVPHTRRELFKALQPLHVAECPFVDLPNSKSDRWGGGVTAEEMHEMQWAKPQLVCQIKFVEWTAEGRLRHAVYLGLRSDKSSRQVHREAY